MFTFIVLSFMQTSQYLGFFCKLFALMNFSDILLQSR